MRPGDGSGLTIDLDLHVGFFAEVLLGRGDILRFDALEDDLLVDILVAVDCVHNPEQFAGIHRLSLPRPENP